MTNKTVRALITILEGEFGAGRPTHPIVIPPDAIAPGVPTHPIFIPPLIDNSLPGNQPGIDNTLPGQQPKPDQGLPGQQPRPDQGLPGAQPGIDNSLPPVVIPPEIWPGPGKPTHPIVLPPDGSPPYIDNTLPGSQPGPDQGLPGQQPGIDNSLPPITFPELPEAPEGVDDLIFVLIKKPGQQAEWIMINSNAETLPPTHPTPKGGKAKK